jgi:hypothetical protein
VDGMIVHTINTKESDRKLELTQTLTNQTYIEVENKHEKQGDIYFLFCWVVYAFCFYVNCTIVEGIALSF